VEWFCNTESHETFSDISGFLEHMHTIHSEPLSQAQLLSLQHGFQQPLHATSGTCTLCGKHANLLKSHLSRHLQQISLFAIPQTDYIAHCEEDDTSSNAARRSIPETSDPDSAKEYSTSSSEAPSLNFSEEYHNTEDNQILREGEWDEVDVVPDVSEHSEGNIDTSWDQITPKFKDARNAMRDEQVADEDEVWEMRDSIELARERIALEEQRMALGEQRMERMILQEQEEHITKSDNLPEHPLTLRQRARRVTSNLFSPLRSREREDSETPHEVSNTPTARLEVPESISQDISYSQIREYRVQNRSEQSPKRVRILSDRTRTEMFYTPQVSAPISTSQISYENDHATPEYTMSMMHLPDGTKQFVFEEKEKKSQIGEPTHPADKSEQATTEA
jgi:hypothetical protein